MTSELANPHDAFFKHYLSQPTVAVDFLRQHLPAEITDLLDLTQLRLEKDSFVDEKLRSYFSDLIYTTLTRQQTPLRIALLWEHKSFPDEWVDFQILRYVVGYGVQEFEKFQAENEAAKKAKEAQEKEEKKNAELGGVEPKQAKQPSPHPRQTLTPVLPLLVYHGQSEWKIELRFARHLAGMEDPNSPLSQALGRYVPDFEPYMINLTALDDKAIQGEVLTQLFMRVLKHIFEQGLGGHLDEILRMVADVIQQPNGLDMVKVLLRYIGRSAVKINKAEMAQKLLELLPKEGEFLMETMAQEWIEEGKMIGIDIGKKEGIDIGIDIGVTEARRQIVKAMVANGFDTTIIAQMLTLPEDEVVQMLKDDKNRSLSDTNARSYGNSAK